MNPTKLKGQLDYYIDSKRKLNLPPQERAKEIGLFKALFTALVTGEPTEHQKQEAIKKQTAFFESNPSYWQTDPLIFKTLIVEWTSKTTKKMTDAQAAMAKSVPLMLVRSFVYMKKEQKFDIAKSYERTYQLLMEQNREAAFDYPSSI